jgi:hypothetical protein
MAGNLDYCLTFDEMEGAVSRLAHGAHAAGTAWREHRVRLPAVVRQRGPRQRSCDRGCSGYTMDNAVFLRLMTQNALESGPPLG